MAKKKSRKIVKKAPEKKIIEPVIEPVADESYKVTLTMTGNDYISEGATIDEALAGLALTWEKIKNKGVIRVEHGKLMTEKLYYLKPLKRIFANKMARFIEAKRLQTLLKETADMLGGHI